MCIYTVYIFILYKIGRVRSRPSELPPEIKLTATFAKFSKKTDVVQNQNVKDNK